MLTLTSIKLTINYINYKINCMYELSKLYKIQSKHQKQNKKQIKQITHESNKLCILQTGSKNH